MSSEIGWGYNCECAASNAGSIFFVIDYSLLYLIP
jgi:hypothetical protein